MFYIYEYILHVIRHAYDIISYIEYEVHVRTHIYLLSVTMDNKISYMHMTTYSLYHDLGGVCMCIYTRACAPLKTACVWLAGTSIPRVHALTRSSELTTCARSRRCTQDLNHVPPRP